MKNIKLLTLGAICAVSGGLMAQTGTSPATQDRYPQSSTQSQDSSLTKDQRDKDKKHKSTAMKEEKTQRSSSMASQDKQDPQRSSSSMTSQSQQDQQRSTSGIASSQGQQQRSTSSSGVNQSQQRSSGIGMQSTQRDSFSMTSSQQGVAKVEAEQKEQILSSSDLVGADITDQNDNKVGTISDLHLSQDGQIEAVHVDIGGVLGIGSTTYRVPFDGLQVNKEGEELKVQVQQQTLQELSNLSPELQDEMEGWETQSDQELATTETETEGRTFGQSMRNMGNEAKQTTAATAGAVGARMEETGRDLQNFGQENQDQSRQFVDRIRNELDSDSPALQDITNVRVQMQQDRLILQGQVKNEKSKQDIVDAAENVAEGREVVDNIQIDRSGAVGAAF